MNHTEIILLITFLVILNAFFSVAEFSIATSRKIKLQQLITAGESRAKLVLELRENPTSFITVIQIGLNVVAILSGIFGEQSFTPIIGKFIEEYTSNITIINTISLAVSVFLITTIFIIFGELIPKKIAFSNPEKIACLTIKPLLGVSKILKPFVWLFSYLADFVLRVLGVSIQKEDKITFDEVSAVINEGAQDGILEKNEHKIIENVFSLTDRTIISAMTLKNDIVYLDINYSQEEIEGKLLTHPHSRFLVCDSSLDNVIGYIESRDILKTILAKKQMVFNRDILREQGLKSILTLPDSISLLEVLDKFRETRQDIACVFNEFGMLVGLITLNDVLATLMGNVVSTIEDVNLIVKRDENSWLIDGTASIEEVKKLFNWEEIENESNYQTINGFLMYKIKCIPKKAQKIEINGVIFEIVDVDGYRIDEVMATRK
jgi:CBS domain containing-hemolysin-like protein